MLEVAQIELLIRVGAHQFTCIQPATAEKCGVGKSVWLREWPPLQEGVRAAQQNEGQGGIGHSTKQRSGTGGQSKLKETCLCKKAIPESGWA